MNAFLANPNIVNNQLFAHSQSTKDRIQQALDAGYEITIHEAPITQDGWTGAGFSVIDPNTGAGGYLIEGGANGGWLVTDILRNALIALLFFISIVSIPLSIIAIVLESPFIAAIGLIGFISSVAYSWLTGDGVFLNTLRLIFVSTIFIVFMQSPAIAAVLGMPLAGMFALALAGLYYAIVVKWYTMRKLNEIEVFYA